MRRTAVALIMTAALVGCGDGDDRLVVSVASSLKNAFVGYGDARYSFAGSDDLAAQIRQGVGVDVFASANTSLPDQLFEEELVEEPVVFATNTLVLAVPDRGATVRSLKDLERDGVTIAAGSPDVPVGAYTRDVLAALGPQRSERILANVRSEEPDVAGVVGKLTLGAVDAGFVYRTDVDATNGELRAIELPPEISPAVQYGVAVVAGSERREAAKEFIAGLLDGEGRNRLEVAGFGPP